VDRPFEALRRRIERAIHEARTGDAAINLSTRVNRSVVVNTGRSGAQQAATNRQTVAIRQRSHHAADTEPATHVTSEQRHATAGRDRIQGGSKDVDARSSHPQALDGRPSGTKPAKPTNEHDEPSELPERDAVTVVNPSAPTSSRHDPGRTSTDE